MEQAILKKIKIGIPKGSLQEHTLAVFESAGFHLNPLGKSYIIQIDDPEIECFMLRPQEIPKYIEEGKLDAGISGDELIAESRAKVIEICDLKYAKQKIKKIKWVLAVSEKSEIKSVRDLEGKVVSTEIVNVARDYFRKKKVRAKVEFSFGATEVKPPLFADAVIDLVETGSAFQAHNLRTIDVVFESSTKLIAGKKAMEDPWKRDKIQSLGILLQGAVESEKTIGLFIHISRDKLKKVMRIMPIFQKATVRKITGTDLYDVFVVSSIKKSRDLIPQLKRMGCSGIVEFPLNKIVV